VLVIVRNGEACILGRLSRWRYPVESAFETKRVVKRFVVYMDISIANIKTSWLFSLCACVMDTFSK